MDLDEVKEQTKNWLDSRLKNPYFGAVIAVWIITNRIVVFSLFNFDNNFGLEDKILFIHNELQKFDRLEFIGGFKGFWATIVWSFFWGYIVMLVADQLNGFGKVLFKIGNRTTNYLLRKVEPLKWIEIKLYNELKKEREDFEEDINKKKIDIKRLQKENDDTVALLNKVSKERDERAKQFEANSQTLQLLEEQVRQQNEEKNKFKVIFAKYGTDNIFIEVTKVVSDLLTTNGKFQANNDNLKFDPQRFAVKKLTIDYQVNSEQKSIIVNEQEIVELDNGQLKTVGTEDSNNLKRWIENLNRLTETMTGQWKMTIPLVIAAKKSHIQSRWTKKVNSL